MEQSFRKINMTMDKRFIEWAEHLEREAFRVYGLPPLQKEVMNRGADESARAAEDFRR